MEHHGSPDVPSVSTRMTGFRDLSQDFDSFQGRTWLNCSHQGPLPHCAVEAAQAAIALKQSPFRLTTSHPFEEVPENLRGRLGQLIGVDPDDIILGNSTSYGMNLLANGLDWKAGDEVLAVRGDFPATLYPGLPLAERGISIRSIDPEGPCLTPAELEAAISPRTRLFCTTLVHSLTGYAVDEAALSGVCRERGVVFVLNGSQAIGNRPFQALESGVDVFTACGFKWLLGPYGTGFCWIRPELRESLRSTQGYWLANLNADDLQGEIPVRLKDNLGARRFDIFCPANFFNFLPWTASLDDLLRAGIEQIAEHDLSLARRLIRGVDPDRYQLRSPEPGPSLTPIVVLDCDSGRQVFERLREAGVDIALRQSALRISPHLYNTPEDVDRLLEVLNE